MDFAPDPSPGVGQPSEVDRVRLGDLGRRREQSDKAIAQRDIKSRPNPRYTTRPTTVKSGSIRPGLAKLTNRTRPVVVDSLTIGLSAPRTILYKPACLSMPVVSHRVDLLRAALDQCALLDQLELKSNGTATAATTPQVANSTSQVVTPSLCVG